MLGVWEVSGIRPPSSRRRKAWVEQKCSIRWVAPKPNNRLGNERVEATSTQACLHEWPVIEVALACRALGKLPPAVGRIWGLGRLAAPPLASGMKWVVATD